MVFFSKNHYHSIVVKILPSFRSTCRQLPLSWNLQNSQHTRVALFFVERWIKWENKSLFRIVLSQLLEAEGNRRTPLPGTQSLHTESWSTTDLHSLLPLPLLHVVDVFILYFVQSTNVATYRVSQILTPLLNFWNWKTRFEGTYGVRLLKWQWEAMYLPTSELQKGR